MKYYERDRRQLVHDCLVDTMSRFLYYDRKEDELLPVGAIEDAIRNGEVTIDALLTIVREELEDASS